MTRTTETVVRNPSIIETLHRQLSSHATLTSY
jgi:hypothetical protein